MAGSNAGCVPAREGRVFASIPARGSPSRAHIVYENISIPPIHDIGSWPRITTTPDRYNSAQATNTDRPTLLKPEPLGHQLLPNSLPLYGHRLPEHHLPLLVQLVRTLLRELGELLVLHAVLEPAERHQQSWKTLWAL